MFSFISYDYLRESLRFDGRQKCPFFIGKVPAIKSREIAQCFRQPYHQTPGQQCRGIVPAMPPILGLDMEDTNVFLGGIGGMGRMVGHSGVDKLRLEGGNGEGTGHYNVMA